MRLKIYFGLIVIATLAFANRGSYAQKPAAIIGGAKGEVFVKPQTRPDWKPLANHTNLLSPATAAFMLSDSPGYAQTPDSAIATIVNVQGHGRIWIKAKTKRRWQANAKNWQLYEGDSVKTDARTSATLLYCKGQAIRLGPKKSHRVTERKDATKFFDILKSAFNREAPSLQGVSRGLDRPPVLIYPCYGKILSNRPVAAWLASTPGTEYRIRFYDANDLLVWETLQQDTTFAYPPNAPKLLDGADYQIEISRKYKNESETSGNFSVAPAEQRAQIAARLKEIQALYQSEDQLAVTVEIVSAALLVREEYFTDAVLALQGALKKQPANRAARTMLAQIYEQVGPPVLIKPMLK